VTRGGVIGYGYVNEYVYGVWPTFTFFKSPSGSGSIVSPRNTFLVSGFKVSGFQGFGVSWFPPNRGRGRGRYRYRYRDRDRDRRPATRDIRPATIDRDARVSDTAGRFSWFQGFIQIGVGVGIAIGIDCLTTNTRDGTARVFIHRFTQITQIFWGIARFFGTPGEIPDFHEVSCFSWFHPNRDRDRYRDRFS
jgi:hypothetical protein